MNVPDVVLTTCRGVRVVLGAVVLGLVIADLVNRAKTPAGEVDLKEVTTAAAGVDSTPAAR